MIGFILGVRSKDRFLDLLYTLFNSPIFCTKIQIDKILKILVNFGFLR